MHSLLIFTYFWIGSSFSKRKVMKMKQRKKLIMGIEKKKSIMTKTNWFAAAFSHAPSVGDLVVFLVSCSWCNLW